MAFSNDIILKAWQRSGGRCECKRTTHNHYGWGCNKQLIWFDRGNDWSPFGWEAHHKVAVSAGGENTLSNCEILCIECHKATRSYGR